MSLTWFNRMVARSAGNSRVRRRGIALRRRIPLCIELLEARAVPATTYLVTSLADTDTAGTLRNAINLANTNHTGTAGDPDLIEFTTGAGTISVGSATAGASLPAVAANEVVIIDATTATGYNGTPLITLDGTSATADILASGLVLHGGSSTVKGFAIVNFSGNGIELETNGGNTVLSSYIGITPAGAAAGNGLSGVSIFDTAGNTIGSTTAIGSANGLGANVISGNDVNGIEIDGSSATGNTVLGNWIGTSTTGAAAVGNADNGVQIGNGATQNTVSGNVISGNGVHGVLIAAAADFNTVSGNYIGTDRIGTTALGNALDGIRIVSSAHNLIGDSDPVTSITYYNADNVSTQPVSGWQGIRAADTPGQYLITGTSDDYGLLFQGTMNGVGQSYTMMYPGALTTSTYGPDNLGNGQLRLVGNYKNPDYQTAPVYSNGFVYEGTTADFSDPSKYRTIDYPGAKYNYVHSTMGDLAVGNYDSPPDHGMDGVPFGPGHAFIYNIASNTFLTDVHFPGSVSNTAYGIWHNGETSYTIVGGYSTDVVNNFDDQTRPIGKAYMVDYDSASGVFSHWKSFDYPAIDFFTHFQGISSVEKGVYTLGADSAEVSSTDPVQGSWVTVRRNTDGSFEDGTWVDLHFTGYGSQYITSANSVVGNQVVGVVIGPGTFLSFQATINTGFQLSNVISGNGSSGVGLYGANDNQIAMNYIGTDVSGTIDLGNGGDGILITDASARNLVGGEATGGNNPTNGVFVRPPQGNLISGNNGNGVFINDGSTENQLSGNFIGTAASGGSPLGNTLDGVAIDDADDNSLIGCLFQQDPFVFYNVVSGNGGSGVRVKDSNNTTIQANFFGMGADNNTPVGNTLDGTRIEGSSVNTEFGGVIPLGNVSAGNGGNGVAILDTASGTVVFNTFCGLPAFVVAAVGNHLDGMYITSTGGNNIIRTSVISNNYGNGVHIGGNATGVQLTEVIIGLDTNGQAALPNGANGVLIDGNAHDNAVGGFQPSVVPQVTISANGGHGVAIIGNAQDNFVFHSFIGTDVFGTAAFGNTGAGIFIGGSAHDNIIGGNEEFEKNVISGNLGGGIQLGGTSQQTLVIGNIIGADRYGENALGNQGSGVSITSSNNQVGSSNAGVGNVIAFNTDAGVTVDTGTSNAIQQNSIFSNAVSGIALINGGNLDQPAPVLTSAVKPTPDTVQITGTLTADPNSSYTIEFFSNPGDVAPAQGKSYLGSVLVTTDVGGVAEFQYTIDLPNNSGVSFTATATDSAVNTSAFSNAIPVGSAFFAIGGSNGLVQVYVANTGTLWTQFAPYGPTYTGGVTVAMGDVTGDGYDDLVTGAAAGNPHVIVFDGFNLLHEPFDPAESVLASWFAYGTGFDVGANVAVGDVNGDGFGDVVTGANTGNPHVKVFSGKDIADGTFDPSGSSLLDSFFAYDAGFDIGVTVAAQFINTDGFADIATGPSGGNPHIKVFDGQTLTTGTGTLVLASWFAYELEFDVGAYVSIGDVDGDGFGDVITGASIGNPQVRVYSGQAIASGSFNPDTDLLAEFFAYATGQDIGVTVGASDRDGDGVFDVLTGNTTGTPVYKAWSIDATTGDATTVLEGTAEGLPDGIYIGG